MQLLRPLPPELAAELIAAAADPELTYGPNDYTCYLGVRNDEAVKDRVARLDVILKDSIAGFSKFCNFTPMGQIRLLYNYNYDNHICSFIGVGYISVDEVVCGCFVSPCRPASQS